MRYLGYGIGHQGQIKPAVSNGINQDGGPPIYANNSTQGDHQTTLPSSKVRKAAAKIAPPQKSNNNQDHDLSEIESNGESETDDEDDMDGNL